MNTRFTIILSLFILVAESSLSQISPGDLAEPHAHLEGISNCTKCHVLGQKVSNEKCLECHILLNDRIKAEKGYHASKEVLGKECVTCHSDHHGRNFEMIRFDPSSFKHQLTGYTLEGTHESLECENCHKKELIVDIEVRKKEFTYLGLGTECLDCHENYHQETLSAQCTECHNQESFRPAIRFDHTNTDFLLLGKHRDVACVECHRKVMRNGREFQEFSGIEHKNCNSCHEDVHENKFGQDCRKCHTEVSFQVIRGMKEFNHSVTDFPLTGKHRMVDCAACHGSFSYSRPLEHERCTDCHEDYHRNQFTQKGVSPDCASCHSTEGFSISSFTIERHNEGSFELKGAHLATPCFACHKKQVRWEFRDIGNECQDCHEDIHKGYIQKKYYSASSCTSCHSEESWGEVSFDHTRTRWRLGTAHEDLSCRSCHFRREGPSGKRIQEFQGLATNCVTCHNDEHQGQFEKEGRTDCTRCHVQDGWQADKFDHNSARFILDGKHKDVACNECHVPVTLGNIIYRKYKFEDISCESCHR